MMVIIKKEYLINKTNKNTFFLLDVSNLQFDPFGMRAKHNKLAHKPSVHVQDDGTIYAICATGSSTKDSLLSWIRLLEKDQNEVLSRIPVLFKFKTSGDTQIVPLQQTT